MFQRFTSFIHHSLLFIPGSKFSEISSVLSAFFDSCLKYTRYWIFSQLPVYPNVSYLQHFEINNTLGNNTLVLKNKQQ